MEKFKHDDFIAIIKKADVGYLRDMITQHRPELAQEIWGCVEGSYEREAEEHREEEERLESERSR